MAYFIFLNECRALKRRWAQGKLFHLSSLRRACCSVIRFARCDGYVSRIRCVTYFLAFFAHVG